MLLTTALWRSFGAHIYIGSRAMLLVNLNSPNGPGQP